jgi:ubiquinone/menaquinone biosynthesis C-methylase UbiE
MESLHQGFRHRAQPVDVEATFRWLDQIDRNPLAQEIKGHMLDLCPVRIGDRVLDVGCGLEHELLRLAQHVGPQAVVVGVDVNPCMIAEARRRAAGGTLTIILEVGDAQQSRVSG